MTWHVIVVVVAVLLGVCFYQKSVQMKNAQSDQEAQNYLYLAYAMWAVAVGVAIYHFTMDQSHSANMCGQRANMCGAQRAYMCGRQM